MPESNKPQWRHHYIPEFYLDRWRPGEGKLVQYSKPYGDVVKPKRIHPRQTAWVRDLYISRGLPPELENQFEKGFFTPVDGKASDVLRNMEAGERLFDASQRSAWARFMMTILYRNPEELRATTDLLYQDCLDVDEAAERRYRASRRPDDPHTFREFMALPDNDGALGRRVLKMMADSANGRNIGERVINMRWGSIHLPVGVPAFLTSDRPVIWEQALVDPHCAIVMPIGPRRLFYAVNTTERMLELYAMQPRDLVDQVNRIVVKRAVRFVYGMGDNQLAFVQKWMSTDIRPTFASRISVMREFKLRRANRKRGLAA